MSTHLVLQVMVVSGGKGVPRNIMDEFGYSSSDSNVLFNDAPLKKLDTSECSFFKNHGMSYPHVGNGLLARPLERSDYDKGYLDLLSQLTKVGNYSKIKYETQFDSMKQMSGCHYIVVIEDTAQSKVVASATLVVEKKFIHGAVNRGRIEDVVVDKDHRKLRLGSFLLELMTTLSRELGCYKVTLDCKADVEGFYTKFGYINEGQLFLSKRYFD